MSHLTLNIKERITIQQIFPEKTSFMDRSICMDISKKVELTTKEKEKVELKMANGSITWNPDKDKGTKYDFSSTEISFLKKCVDELDKAKLITNQNFELCKKIKEIN